MGSRFPVWMRKQLPRGSKMLTVENTLSELGLHTVCQSALCPNRGECYANGTSTFLILGDTCTRGCRFCAVTKGVPQPLDPEEPAKVAEAARMLNLNHVVVTSVTRDDLPDGGASHFVATINCLHEMCPQTKIEVLTPDFAGQEASINSVMQAKPHVFNHNIETIKRLYQKVRPQADYQRSLALLQYVKTRINDIYTKSGLMVGLGEEFSEVVEVLTDLASVGCDIVTIGQYLQPSSWHLPVERYIPPEEFTRLEETAYTLGIKYVYAGPYVRSSYRAHEVWDKEKELNV